MVTLYQTKPLHLDFSCLNIIYLLNVKVQQHFMPIDFQGLRMGSRIFKRIKKEIK